MTLTEIYELARDYIPTTCRKKVEYTQIWTYWPAHEIGHFLVANKAEIKREEYGLDRSSTTRAQNHAVAHELAAMHVSWHLLMRVSPRLARSEVEETDEYTLDQRYDKQIVALRDALIRRAGIKIVPTRKESLRRLLQRKRHALGLRFKP